ncbi:MAG TPA: hypothetical protein V6C57_23145, partial [Coleofasciculaceae cyanobacterium]
SVSVGKFGYAPYEQIRMGQCSPKSDLYALAVTAVVLLTGKPPNLLIDPRSLEWQWQTKVRLNPRLVEILEKMMAEKPHDRYPSAKIILRELHLLGQSVHNLGAVPQHPAGRNLHPRYRSDIALPSSQLSHTGIKLVSPPHGLPPLHHEAALPLPQVGALTTQITSAHIATLESTHAETPTQVATQIVASDNETKVQSYTELLRSGLYTPTSRLSHGSTSSRATQVTTLPYTTSRVLIREPHKPYIQLKNVLALGLLALLPVSGMLLGVQSPYIASACQLLNNCAGDEQSEIRYRHAVEQAVGAKTLSENAHNLVDLQHARDRLADSLAQLGSMSGGTKIYAEAQQALLNYRNTLEQLETHLEKETRAAQLLKRAEAEAEKATEQTKAAQTVESYKTAELQWRRALMTLRTVQPDTFASNQVAARLQEYSARLQAVSLRIPGSPKPYSQATEWLQPRVIQSARLPQSTGAPNSSGTPSQQSNFQANVAPNSLRQGPTFQASGQAIASPPNQSGQTQLISNLRLDPTSGASSNVPGRFPASSRSRAGNSSSAEVPVRQVLAPAAASSNISRQSRLAQPMPIAAAPNNPFNSALFTGSAPLSAFQTLNDVSLGLDGAWINPGGTYVANLVLENYSQRPFGFVPLFAEVRDASGQAVQSRILLRGSEDGVVEPGETLRGQLFLLDRHWNNAGSQNLTLVIQEGTSGSRNFHLPF